MPAEPCLLTTTDERAGNHSPCLCDTLPALALCCLATYILRCAPRPPPPPPLRRSSL